MAESSTGGRKRPLTVDDLLCLEEIGEVALSPDGRWLAYVLKRPRQFASFHKYDFLHGGDRADVWLVDTSGGTARNLTGGADDGSGYWAPTWSPDSERLAMLSTKGGNVHPWGYELSSGNLARLTERSVDVGLQGAPILWVSDGQLLVATLPEGERPIRMTVEIQAAEVAMRQWPKAWKGAEPTGSVLDSGSSAPFDERPQGELLLVDAANGEQRTIMRGLFRALRIAPDRGHVAFFRQVDVIRPEATRKLALADLQRYRLGIVTAEGELVASGIEEVDEPEITSLRWSADSAEVALIGREAQTPEAPTRIFRYRLADGRIRVVTDADLKPRSIAWTADGDILALAQSTEETTEDGMGRRDWWLVSADQRPRKLTAEMSDVPPHLVPEEGHRSFVGLAAGDVFRISLSDGACSKLTASFEHKVTWLAWPTPAGDGRAASTLVLAVEEAECTAWHSLELRSGDLRALPWPTDRGRLADFAPEHATAIPVAVDRTGARLWISKPAFENHTTVLETNTWLRDVAEGEVRRIDYRGLDGDDLRAWVILPVDCDPAKRYPLVVDVYPGLEFARDEAPMRIASITAHHCLNLQLLAARGFAVLLPSMPLKPKDESSDPYLELTKGVLPAVDEAIDMGIADPDRLGLMGQSYGGYGTYGLITQTPRFRAAVALAGFADLVSLYGQFDARFRYGEQPHEHVMQMSLCESGQLRMGGPPWKDPDRYVRNSPLFEAERVETPVLIIQGDMDYVALQQGEQFFSALYRQGKRARFVRYWGEGHVFQSPANIRDMWEQIYGWFDEFL